MKIWLDDVRKPPSDEWTWVKTCADAISAVRECARAGVTIEAMSLDHDLGAHELVEQVPEDKRVFLRGTATETGFTFVKWLVENPVNEHNPVVRCRYTIHSWNPDGAARMAKLLSEHGHIASVEPFRIR